MKIRFKFVENTEKFQLVELIELFDEKTHRKIRWKLFIYHLFVWKMFSMKCSNKINIFKRLNKLLPFYLNPKSQKYVLYYLINVFSPAPQKKM
jgi:hypothetical protein